MNPAPPPLPALLQVPHLLFGLSPTTLAEVGGGAAAVVLVTVVALLRARRAAPPTPPPSEQPVLPGERLETTFKVTLPKSAEEEARLAELEEVRTRADELARSRRLLQMDAERTADATERSRLEAEARALKEREEDAKREQYRAQKAVDKEARERREHEREEALRLEAEAQARTREEAAAQKSAAALADRKKVDAEAGQTLAQGLAKTRSQGFMARLNGLFSRAPGALDESVLAELEEVLFTADIGVKTASRLVELARERIQRNEVSDMPRVKALIRAEIEKILTVPQPPSLEGGGPLHVTMVVGVNGAGKTTTIGKLAAKRTSEGKRVILAAGDTFRAAATEQLDVWAERARAELVKGADGADPGSVMFDAIRRGLDQTADLVLADTAGRLHTQAPLMEELKKVKRVMAKALPGAPHEVLLVLDATNGQNAIAQAKQFHEAVGVTAIVLTKLDGTAKGGVIIGICDELKLPVAWVGVGEKVADLRRFDPREFVEALFEA